MGMQKKAEIKAQALKGKMEQKLGSALGKKHLETKGVTDETNANLDNVMEKTKDAALSVKNAVKK
jgi:uncharacterized protein YjbJ (UPF0337 family)